MGPQKSVVFEGLEGPSDTRRIRVGYGIEGGPSKVSGLGGPEGPRRIRVGRGASDTRRIGVG